ncbi:MAG: hypothetical protein BWY89_01551 [Bacteroidetes bacterium ADurb.BinA012]|nr:MAG: hypothetical protein BWY89_01551 [Bacteroidetes bacterium ADurb.BinA012]
MLSIRSEPGNEVTVSVPLRLFSGSLLPGALTVKSVPDAAGVKASESDTPLMPDIVLYITLSPYRVTATVSPWLRRTSPAVPSKSIQSPFTMLTIRLEGFDRAKIRIEIRENVTSGNRTSSMATSEILFISLSFEQECLPYRHPPWVSLSSSCFLVNQTFYHIRCHPR